MIRAWKSHIQEKNILVRKEKRIKKELTQKNKSFDPKCSLTPQFCHGTI